MVSVEECFRAEEHTWAFEGINDTIFVLPQWVVSTRKDNWT